MRTRNPPCFREEELRQGSLLPGAIFRGHAGGAGPEAGGDSRTFVRKKHPVLNIAPTGDRPEGGPTPETAVDLPTSMASEKARVRALIWPAIGSDQRDGSPGRNGRPQLHDLIFTLSQRANALAGPGLITDDEYENGLQKGKQPNPAQSRSGGVLPDDDREGSITEAFHAVRLWKTSQLIVFHRPGCL
jgi:hypothetical protein